MIFKCKILCHMFRIELNLKQINKSGFSTHTLFVTCMSVIGRALQILAGKRNIYGKIIDLLRQYPLQNHL